MARVYADVNQNMPRAYWDYDSVNISERTGPGPEGRTYDVAKLDTILTNAGWGVLENYEVVRKIGMSRARPHAMREHS